jgi:electron transfer flavoprotein beta subunit
VECRARSEALALQWFLKVAIHFEFYHQDKFYHQPNTPVSQNPFFHYSNIPIGAKPLLDASYIANGIASRKIERTFAFLLTHLSFWPKFGHMKILVCVKQVPESDDIIQIDKKGNWIQADSFNEFKMNRLDEFAVEEAIRLKESFDDVTIDILSVGPERSADVIKRAIGMGADHGIHIKTDIDEYMSPSSVATGIAEYATNKSYGLILTGAMSEDHMNAQVGPMIAAHLDLPCATGTILIELSSDKKILCVEREIEGGIRDMLELKIPAVVTIQSGPNTPRYPSLSNLLRANKQQLEIIDAGSPPQTQAGETILRLTYPVKSRGGEILTGSPQQKAKKLLKILREKAFIA